VDAQMPLGLLLLVLGVPNVYVGCWLALGRGVPQLVARDRVLTYVFTDDWLPPGLRGTRTFEAGVRVVIGGGLAVAGLLLALLASTNAFA
jgi:hypothetical protein